MPLVVAEYPNRNSTRIRKEYSSTEKAEALFKSLLVSDLQINGDGCVKIKTFKYGVFDIAIDRDDKTDNFSLLLDNG